MLRRRTGSRSQAALALGLALALSILALGPLAVAHAHDDGDSFASSCALCRWLSHAAPPVALAVAVSLTLPVTGAAEPWRPRLLAREPDSPVRPRGPPLT